MSIIVMPVQPALQYLDMDAAIKHCTQASASGPRNDQGAEPDVVMACCGDIPTMETLPLTSASASARH